MHGKYQYYIILNMCFCVQIVADNHLYCFIPSTISTSEFYIRTFVHNFYFVVFVIVTNFFYCTRAR